MGLREKANENPKVVAGITGGVLLIAIVVGVWSMRGSSPAGSVSTKDFYTIDDGKTTFVDEAFPQRVPPFTKDGKTAYKAIVWSCDGGKTPIVSGLQRFNKIAKDRLQALVDAKKLTDPLILTVMETEDGTEVKAPKTGDASPWLPRNDPKATDLIIQPCPPGGTQVRMEAR